MSKPENMSCCLYCGNEEYYIKQKVKGFVNFNIRFDGAEADNSSMYDLTDYKNASKFAFCSGCGRKSFKIID